VSRHNWAGNVTFATDDLRSPESLEQLQEIVAGHDRVRAIGTGHSFNRIADTTGVLVSVRSLPGGLTVDETAGTVRVPGGVRYGEVAAALHERGLALHNLGSLPHISVAGACATGTHGSGDGNRCLPAAAVGVEFVRADGESVTVTSSDDGFAGSVLSLGALGVVTHLTLAVQPTYELRQDVWLDARLDAVLENYDDVTSAGYSVSLFCSAAPTTTVGQIWIKSRADAPPVDGSSWGARPATVDVHPIIGQDARAATRQGGVPGPWFERLPHFRASFTPSSGDEQQTELLIGREHATDAIAAVLALDLGDVLQVIELRTVAADELWLSPFHGRASTALHFTWNDDDAAVARAVGKVEAALSQYDPRPHWGKVFAVPGAEVAAHYPRLGDFRELMRRHDPDRKFGNAFLERFVY
jgi:xylitol oxidase